LASTLPSSAPSIWVIPAHPATTPSCGRGTWSGIVAYSPACTPARPSCTTSQPVSMVVTESAEASSTKPTAASRQPAATHGRRRPNRERVRSLIAPKAGTAAAVTAAPSPIASPSSASLRSGANSSACRASWIWVGVRKASHMPVLATANRVIQARPTGPPGPGPPPSSRAGTGTVALCAMVNSPAGSAESDCPDSLARGASGPPKPVLSPSDSVLSRAEPC
jgi:hypothetical protein